MRIAASPARAAPIFASVATPDTGAALRGASEVAVTALSSEQYAALTPSALKGLSSFQLRNLSPSVFSQLSQTQIQQIFSGRVRAWNKIAGSRVSGSIDIITRTASSGTADAFQNIFMGTKLRIAANAAAKNSNALVQQTVHSDKNAIGFVSFDFVGGTHPVPYRGVTCNLRNAKAGTYGGVRNFWMVTRGAPAGPAKAWIKWIQNSSAARAIINTHWLPRK